MHMHIHIHIHMVLFGYQSEETGRNDVKMSVLKSTKFTIIQGKLYLTTKVSCENKDLSNCC